MRNGLRDLITFAVVAFLLALVFLAARRGWRARAAGQADIAAPPVPPADTAPPEPVVPVLYVSSVRAGDWLDRVVAHGLGVRARGTVGVVAGGPHPGIVIDRAGAPALFIAAGALHAVRRDTGIAGKVGPRPELVVLTWDCGGTELDTGVRPGTDADRHLLAAAAADLIGVAA